MVEIMAAISVLLFGIVAIYGVFSNVVTLTYGTSARFTAAYLAQEGMETIRNIRDNNFISGATWSAGLLGSPCSTGCMADYKTKTSSQLVVYNDALLGLNSDGFYSYDSGSVPTIFKRKITISSVQGTTNILNVDVMVFWNYNGQSFNFDTSEYLYNWY